MSEVGGSNTTKLVDVCSYPSQQPNSDPSDCILATQAQTGKLEIIKSVVPSNDPGQFNLLVDGAILATGGNGTTTGEQVVLASGGSGTAHTFAETAGSNTLLSNYTTSASCVEGTTTVSTTGTNPWTVNVGNNDNIVCTITNTRINNASLTIVKDAQPNDAQDFAFTVTGSGLSNFSLDDDNDVTLSNTKVFSNLAAGTYAVAETPLTGWDLTTATCSDGSLVGNINLSQGENVTCTFTNAKQPTLTVIKSVTNNNGGTLSPSNFPLFVDQTSVVSGATNTYALGTYTISETQQAGYTQTSLTCDNGKVNPVTLNYGDNVTCTLVNDDIAPQLTVIKHVINDNGGNKVAGDFTMTVNGSNVSNTSFSGAETPGTTVTLNAGAYSVDEVGLTGYAKSLSADCSGTIAIGQSKTCTVTNDDIAPTLTLVKTVINDNGGNLQVSQVPLFISGSPATSGVAYPVLANTLYTASETPQTGYLGSVWGGDCSSDGTITLNPGDAMTCTITNNDIAPTLTFIKLVTNNYGGTLDQFDFPLYINGSLVTSGSSNILSANTLYTLSEDQQYGYSGGTFSGDCSSNGTITLNPGDNKTCYISNYNIQPQLTVTKVVVNDNGGTKQVSDFPLFVDSTSVTSGVQTGFSAGSYTVSETSLPGYTATITGDCASDGSITLAVGDVKSCTITNDDQPGTLIVNKVVVNDNGGNSTADDFSYQVNGNSAIAFEADGSNSQTLNSGYYTITEPAVSGYTTTYNNCKRVFVPNGGSATCTITNDDIAPTLRLVKNVVIDNGGNETATGWTLTASGSELGFSDTGDSSTFHSVKAGISYTLSESIVPGYAADSWSCDGGTLIGDVVTLVLDEDVTCQITNDDIAPTITLIKSVIGGPASANSFGLTVSDTPVSSGETLAVLANTAYSLNEEGLSGYSFTSLTGDVKCPTVLGGTVSLDEDEDITCTITNTRDTGSITIVKDAINNHAKNFSFVTTGGGNVPATIYLDDDNDPTLPNSQTYLTPTGTYTFTEEQVNGWKLTDLTCVGDNNGTVDISSRQATINLDKNETVTCTFVNTQLGSIQGRKYNDVNGNGDLDSNEKINANRLNGWTINLYKDNTIIKSMSTGDDNTEAGSVEKGQYRFINLLPGTYDICEVPQNGWHQTEPANGVQHSEQTNCHTVNLSAGQNLDTIQFGNFRLGRIYGYKYEDHNGNGAWDQGESGLSNWTIKLGSTTTTTNTDGYFEFANLLAGNYVLSEDETNPDFARTQPTAGSYNIAISSGTGYNQESDYLFGNAPLTNIHGYKWNDVNGNGERDCTRFEGLLRFEINQECEDLLGDWTIFLDENGNELLDEGETSTTTDNNPESKDYGWYIFHDLMPGEYTICEVKKDGWQQTYPLGEETICHHIVVPNDNEQTENGVVGPEYDFGNQAKPVLRIQKTNDATGNKNPGDIITYTLTLDLASSDLSDVTVTDVTPQGFTYVAGSYTSSQPGISEPNYGSPGTWNIGDMLAGDTITLTYQAKIGSDQDGGTYSDIAWGQGSSSAWGTVLAQGHDSTYLDSLYVGTDVTIVKNMDQTGSVNVERTGEVLGASTELPATGSNTGWLILAIGLLLLGLALIFGGKMKVILVVLFSLSPFLMSRPLIAHAADPDNQLSVRIEQPQTPTRSNDWKLGFSVLDRSFGTPTVTCYVKKPSSGSYVSFGATHTSAKPEGDNGSCLVDSSVVSEQGTYSFYVTAVSGELSENSATVTVLYDTEGPDRPVYYHKENIGYCHNKISFRSADDGGRTSSIQIFGSTNTTFNTDAGTRLGSVTLGSNQEGSFTHNQVGEDCNKTWYYVIRAYDSVGNSSAHLGDEIVTITTITPSAPTFGAIPVTTGAGSVLGQEASATATNTATPAPEQTSNVEGSGLVAGIKDVVNTATSNPKIWYYLAGVVLLILGIYVYSRRR